MTADPQLCHIQSTLALLDLSQSVRNPARKLYALLSQLNQAQPTLALHDLSQSVRKPVGNCMPPGILRCSIG